MLLQAAFTLPMSDSVTLSVYGGWKVHGVQMTLAKKGKMVVEISTHVNALIFTRINNSCNDNNQIGSCKQVSLRLVVNGAT